MPPLRNLPMIKPVKTERTHEENQERAYIAASRRSDRSLEARVESARRASEIHKRRTGRSLRVTEQDVVNEEMYEEEDDDLPMQYRRLTAHLQTSNADFDRRLAAYLTNHVAMRTALGQAVHQSQNQSSAYPNATQFASQSPIDNQHSFNPQQSMGPPQHNKSPMSFRQSPYPLPQHAQKQAPHNRSISIASPNDMSNASSHFQLNTTGMDARRNSSPAHHALSSSRQVKKQRPSITNLKFESGNGAAGSMLSPPKSESGSTTPPQSKQSPVKPSEFPSPFNNHSHPMATGYGGMPFSTTLPAESQQLLAGSFDFNDPMTSMLMGQDFNPYQQMYPDADGKQIKPEFNQTSAFNGMNQTLAPGFLDTSVGGYGMDAMTDSPFTDNSPFGTSAGGHNMGFDGHFNDAFKGGNFGNGLTSGEVTPSNERDWANLINGTAWEESSSQQNAV